MIRTGVKARSGDQGRRCGAPVAIALSLVLLFARGAVAENQPEPEPYASLESIFTLYQPYLPNIRAYEPMYFLVGTQPRKSKFQFSFQYRPLNASGPLARSHPWVNGFHLAYTQTSLWDLQSDSKPFEDTSYKPELFFLSGNLRHGEETRLRVFVQGGVQHESNGLGGEFSRSTNVVYCKPTLIWLWRDTLTGLQLAPRFWLYVG
ncbi:MAG TPA: phospholipase A, partial [Deferrisomatales bacterium]|nr:phospholipase A [Deferrisomatales bacterium]